MHLDIHYIQIHNKNYESRSTKVIINCKGSAKADTAYPIFLILIEDESLCNNLIEDESSLRLLHCGGTRVPDRGPIPIRPTCQGHSPSPEGQVADRGARQTSDPPVKKELLPLIKPAAT
jgi:hypothetical protein